MRFEEDLPSFILLNLLDGTTAQASDYIVAAYPSTHICRVFINHSIIMNW